MSGVLYALVRSAVFVISNAFPDAPSIAVIIVFLKLVSTRSYMPFFVYRIALGALVLALLQTGMLSPH